MPNILKKLSPIFLVTIICILVVELFYFSLNELVFHNSIPKSINSKISYNPEYLDTIPSTYSINPTIIVQRNMFHAKIEGKLPDHFGDMVEKLYNLDKLNGGMKLLGTIENKDGNNRAIILTKTNEQQNIYRVGDMIEDAEIIEIIRGKAIVKIDGKALLLDMSDSTNINTNNPAPEPISASRNFRQQQIISNATGNIPKKSSSSKKITIRMPKNTLKNTITTGEKD